MEWCVTPPLPLPFPSPAADGSAVSLDGFPECVARLRAKNEEGFNDEYEVCVVCGVWC